MTRASLFALIAAVSTLVTIGLIMLASTSYFEDELAGSSYATLKQQCFWLVVSVILCTLMAGTDYNIWYRFRWWIYGLTTFGLVLCFVPLLSESVNGASRWVSLKKLGLPAAHLQPSEFAKITAAVLLAGWYARYEPQTREFKAGFLVPGLLAVTMIGLIGAEVDLGNAALIGSMSFALMFVAGVRLKFLIPLVLAGVGGLIFVVQMMPNRVSRILAFLDLEKHKEDFGLQQWRALFSFGSGGWLGMGLGYGRQKYGYLPEAHTDFAFPMIGEELGLLGTGTVVLMFFTLAVSGVWIALHAPNRFGRLLAFGIVLMLSMEALMNMGVTTAMLPNKGLPLPFVSYGGSSLLAAMMGVGILLNIHRQSHMVTKNDLLEVRRRRMTAAI